MAWQFEIITRAQTHGLSSTSTASRLGHSSAVSRLSRWLNFISIYTRTCWTEHDIPFEYARKESFKRLRFISCVSYPSCVAVWDVQKCQLFFDSLSFSIRLLQQTVVRVAVCLQYEFACSVLVWRSSIVLCTMSEPQWVQVCFPISLALTLL